MKIAVISVTDNGDEIGRKINEYYDVDIFSRSYVKENGLRNITKDAFEKYRGIIFVSSTGIAVRSIAPFLKSKKVDPAVISIDSSGKYVISLVSGHLGGANELALKIADIINAEPIITTATDNLGIIAPDVIAKDNNLIIDNFRICKDIASLIVHGKNVLFIDEDEIVKLPKGYVDSCDEEIYGVIFITNKYNLDNDQIKTIYNSDIPILKLIRKNIVLGIGCRKDYDCCKMRENVLSQLEKYNIDKRAVSTISTVEIKKDEKAIIELANYLKCDTRIFTVNEIKNIHNHYPGSDFVEKTIGVRAVCEPCVELTEADLLTDKIKCSGMTLCIGHIKINNERRN
jgi:cobalt-precorrin 5A hydrolase